MDDDDPKLAPALPALIDREPSLPAILYAKLEQAAAYAKAARAEATRRAYASDWAIFTE